MFRGSQRKNLAKKYAVLHVGLNKTATTSLQALIFENREDFALQGLYYPEASRTYFGHHHLVKEEIVPGHPEATGALDALVAELSAKNPAGILLSAEGLHQLVHRPHRLVEIRDALRSLGYEVSILLTLREVGGYVEALYAELHKQGLRISPEVFCAEVMTTKVFRLGDRVLPFDFPQIVETFDEIFGHEHLDVLEYGPEVVPQLLDQICERLGISLTLPAPIPFTNIRIRGEGSAPPFEPALLAQVRSALGDSLDELVNSHRRRGLRPARTSDLRRGWGLCSR